MTSSALRAVKVGGRWQLWIKWKDIEDATPEWRSDILEQTTNPELIQEIEDAVARARAESNDRTHAYEEDDPAVL